MARYRHTTKTRGIQRNLTRPERNALGLPLRRPCSRMSVPDRHPELTRERKLEEELTDRGIPFAEDASLGGLEHIWDRVKREQLIYANCTVAELARFVEQKSLSDRWLSARPEPGHKPCLKTGLIAVLEAAEEDTCLTDFMGMPPEMKDKVWDSFFEFTDGFVPTRKEVKEAKDDLFGPRRSRHPRGSRHYMDQSPDLDES
ncbi:hypothetical protein LTR53_000826 [Teratosphaeriaceae sp. CCFEE 6253]|nr:hypothetical protein LTR53_000826 [Teratosphaeriaceae sp. CCFEE 6253]